jgi:hypothetical protein
MGSKKTKIARKSETLIENGVIAKNTTPKSFGYAYRSFFDFEKYFQVQKKFEKKTEKCEKKFELREKNSQPPKQSDMSFLKAKSVGPNAKPPLQDFWKSFVLHFIVCLVRGGYLQIWKSVRPSHQVYI